MNEHSIIGMKKEGQPAERSAVNRNGGVIRGYILEWLKQNFIHAYIIFPEGRWV